MNDKHFSDAKKDIIIEEEKIKLNLDSLENKIKKRRIKDGIINIIGTSLQKIQISIVSSLSSLMIYLVYFLYSENHDETITKENALTLSSIISFSVFSTVWIGGFLKHYIGIRTIMIISNVALILACLGLIFFRSLNKYQMMMIFFGIGIGIPQTITNVNAIQYMPEKKGLIGGILNISWTLGCSFFNFLGLQFVNPKNRDINFFESEKKEKRKEKHVIYFGDDNEEHCNIIKYMFVIIACFVVLSILSIIFTSPFNKEKYEPNEQKKDKKENKNVLDNEYIFKERKTKEDEDEIKFVHFLKTWRFYTCFLYCSFKNIHNNLIGSSFQIFAIHYDTVSISTQKIIITLSFIVNLVTTFCLSFFIDKFKYKNIIIPNFICILIHALTFQFIKANGVLYIIYFFLIGVFQVIDNLSTFPHFYKIFGAKYVAMIFGIFNIGTGFFNFGFNYFVKYILSGKQYGDDYDHSVDSLIYISALFIGISIFLMSLENEKPVLSQIKSKSFKGE